MYDLDASARSLATRFGTYRLVAADVLGEQDTFHAIVTYLPHRAQPGELRFTAFRYAGDGSWLCVDGGWFRLYEARRSAAKLTASHVVQRPELAELLALALDLSLEAADDEEAEAA